MKLQYFLINMVYWMFVYSSLKHPKTQTEKVAFFLSLTVYILETLKTYFFLVSDTHMHTNKYEFVNVYLLCRLIIASILL